MHALNVIEPPSRWPVTPEAAGSRNYEARDKRGSWLLGSLVSESKKELNDDDHDPYP